MKLSTHHTPPNGPGRSAGARQRALPQGWRIGWRLVGGLGWLALALGACIIEERNYSVQLDDCWDYCELLERNCSGSNKVYETRDSCMATCMLMDNGRDSGDSTINTLACRLDKLRAGDFESPQCPLVGPGGGGACGTNCQALCALRKQVCRDVPNGFDTSDVNDTDTCESDCAALYDRQLMDAGDIDRSGDTVQCRLVYVSKAAVSPADAEQFCRFSQIVPEPGEDQNTFPCSDAAGLSQDLECEKYCNIVTTACTDVNAVYQSEAQCLDTCKKTMVSGAPGDTTPDTIRCRRYHAYYSLLEPSSHCLHASPTGDGHCGKENCTGYCRVAQQACPAEFAAGFGATAGTTEGGMMECITQCNALDGATKDAFALPPRSLPRFQLNPPPTGNNVMCRAYHAVEALTDPRNHCAAALGAGECQ